MSSFDIKLHKLHLSNTYYYITNLPVIFKLRHTWPISGSKYIWIYQAWWNHGTEASILTTGIKGRNNIGIKLKVGIGKTEKGHLTNSKWENVFPLGVLNLITRSYPSWKKVIKWELRYRTGWCSDNVTSLYLQLHSTNYKTNNHEQMSWSRYH